MRSCASPTCASAAASSPPAAVCRSISGCTRERRQRKRPRSRGGRGGRRATESAAKAPLARWSRMTSQWPEMLGLLVLVPAVVLAYLLLLRRKKKAAMRYASLSLVRDAMGTGYRLRRHIPPILYL